MNFKEKLLNYQPFNEQEEKDKEYLLYCLENEPHVFERDNFICHFTVSSWTVNKDKTKVLMVYHNIYNSWSWLGGHNDGEEDMLKVAIKEVKEESGIQNVKAVDENIFSLEVLTVDGHVKKGQYVSSHLHLNVTYLLEADEDEVLTIKEDENSGVKWFKREDAPKASSEKWFVEHIYNKLNQKLDQMYPLK